MNKNLLIFVVLTIALTLSTSTDISCSYGDNGNYYGIVGYIYQCEVEDDPIITTNQSAQITSITGTHRSYKSDDSVYGIRAADKTIKFFPKGMENFFKNLNVIDFYRVGMMEVHQSDLKPFPELTVLYLGHNSIEVLEKGLFDYNPNLQVIAFPYNEIKHIYPNIFDNLNKLVKFWFLGNNCISREYNLRIHMVYAIEHIKEHCSPVLSESEELDDDDRMSEHTTETVDSEEGYDVDEISQRKSGCGKQNISWMIFVLITIIFYYKMRL